MLENIDFEKIKKVEKRIPIVSDKALIDLIQSIEINQGQLSQKRGQTKVNRLFEVILGKSAERQLLIEENFQTSIESIINMSIELMHNLNITTQCVQIIQKALIKNKEYIEKFSNQFQSIDNKFIQLERELENTKAEFNNKLKTIELRLLANEHFDSILTAWESKRTYSNLPILIQIIFVLKELFSSAIGYFERVNINDYTFRKRIIDKILVISKEQKFEVSLKAFAQTTLENLNIEDRSLVLSLLNYYSNFNLYRPFQFLLENLLEFSLLKNEVRPHDCSGLALELTRNRYNSIHYNYEKRDLIEIIVNEIANESLQMIYETE